MLPIAEPGSVWFSAIIDHADESSVQQAVPIESNLEINCQHQQIFYLWWYLGQPGMQQSRPDQVQHGQQMIWVTSVGTLVVSALAIREPESLLQL